MSEQSLYNQNQGLSNIELRSYFQKHQIPYHEIDGLKNLANPRSKQAMVYTGSNSDDINKGVTKHWIYYTPISNSKKELFDSYGDESAYNSDFFRNNNINFVNKRQFQAFDTNVCGEYCAAWAKFLHDHPQRSDLEHSELLEQFIQKHGLTKNRVENDKKIKEYYDQTK